MLNTILLKMKLLSSIFLIIFSSLIVNAQDISMRTLHPKDTINIPCTSVCTNLKDLIYAITDQNEVLLLDTSGKILKRYSNNYLGTPQFIYFQNPLQLVLFYPAYQTMIILDHSFNELVRIALSTLDIPYVHTIGLTANREIIYFDNNTQLFRKTNYVTKISQSFIGSPTRQIGQIKVILTRKNEFKAQTELELIGWDGSGFSQGATYGQIIEWNDESILFYNPTSPAFVNYISSISGIQVFRTSLPESFNNIISIGLLREGVVGIDGSGHIIIFRTKG